eukprot:9477019-Pyramimonas_sp.AAC.1
MPAMRALHNVRPPVACDPSSLVGGSDPERGWNAWIVLMQQVRSAQVQPGLWPKWSEAWLRGPQKRCTRGAVGAPPVARHPLVRAQFSLLWGVLPAEEQETCEEYCMYVLKLYSGWAVIHGAACLGPSWACFQEQEGFFGAAPCTEQPWHPGSYRD